MSAYTSILDHLTWYIVEAPSQQAVENYFIEIGFAFWNDVEIRQAKLVEDVMNILYFIGFLMVAVGWILGGRKDE